MTMLRSEDADHKDIIEKAYNDSQIKTGEDELLMITNTEEIIKVSKSSVLLFSPFIRSLLDSVPCCKTSSLILPDFSPSSVKHLHNLLGTGASALEGNYSYKEIYELIGNAKVLGIHLSDL